MAKKEKVPKNPEVKDKKKRNLKANRRRGNAFEVKIAKELRELGFDMVTSRSESKAMDNAKVDLIDKSGLMPCNLQLKKTIKYPNFLEIEKSCPIKNKPLALIWDVQRATDSTFRSDGTVVVMRKEFFYELIKHYGKSNSNI